MSQPLTWVLALALLWIPGRVIHAVLRPRPRFDRAVALAEQLGLGLAFWPLLLLWTSTLHWMWTATAARILFAVLCAASVFVLIRGGGAIRLSTRLVPLWIVAGLTAFSRIWQVRGVALPLWVDSVHHTMIVRLIVGRGSLPDSYAPFIPHSTFYYHWGFHAGAAFLAWIGGVSDPVAMARLLLDYGQFLNALTPVFMYAAGRVLFGTRRAGVLAAALGGLVSFFPAYYVSWGRYTHLAGVLLLPVFAIALWRTARRRTLSNAMELSLFAAGLILVHVRIAFFALTLAMVLAAVLVRHGNFSGLTRWAMAGCLAIVMTSPWLLHLGRSSEVRLIVSPGAAEASRWETSNSVQKDLLWSPNNAALMTLATAGLIALTPVGLTLPLRAAGIAWWLAVAFLIERQARRKRVARRLWTPLALVGAWAGLTMLFLNLDRFGMTRFRPVPNNAAIITMFIPLSIAGAGLLAWFIAGLVRPGRRAAAGTVAALVLAIGGCAMMLRIINPATLLSHDADVRAMRWIAGHTPADAKFAVLAQPWIAGSWVGVDGGYWIPVLTDRQSILPPGLYTWVAPAADVDETDALLRTWSSASSWDGATRQRLLSAGVQYAYFGTQSAGSSLRHALESSGDARRLYSVGGAEVFALK